MTNDEIRMKCEARNPKVAAAAPAGSRSAELHSAVSQSCTLLRAGESGALAFHVRQVPACVDARTQGIRRLRLHAGSAQFKLHASNSRISVCGEHGAIVARAGKLRNRTIPCALQRSAELHSAVSQSYILRRAGEAGGTGQLPHPAEYNSAIQQIENLRYEAAPNREGHYRPRGISKI